MKCKNVAAIKAAAIINSLFQKYDLDKSTTPNTPIPIVQRLMDRQKKAKIMLVLDRFLDTTKAAKITSIKPIKKSGR